MITFCCEQLHRGLASILDNLAQAPGERERPALLRLRLFCNAASLRAAVRRRIFLLVALPMLLLVGLPAQAATDYIFAASSNDLPVGCELKHGEANRARNYTCGVLTLEANDTITVGKPGPITITFTGAFTTGTSNLINANEDVSELSIVTNGVLTLGDNTMLNANVVGTAAVNLGIGSAIGGNLTASTTTGVVTLAADSRVGGYIRTDAGAVNIGDKGAVGSDITTAAGVVTLTTNIKVGGNITTVAGGITIGDNSAVGGDVTTVAGVVTLTKNITVGGNITTVAGGITIGNNSAICGNVSTTGAGVVTLTTNVKVGGNVSTTTGGITIGAGSAIGGNVTITGAGVATLTSVQVGGNISTVAGAITLTSSRVGGSVTITGAGVFTQTSSTVNDKTLVVSPACSSTPIPPTSPTCIVDDFASGTLNPALWNPLQIDGSYTPAVVDVGGQKRIRMTTAAGNQSTMLQLKKWFPGAGNKITVAFDYYVYGGNGADGVTVVFSDASVAPAPGGFGGSLGYAQRNDPKNGFSGGWLAVGIDEFGNFPNSTEGRKGYPASWTAPDPANKNAGFYPNNISVRGSGSGTTGYPLLANTGTLSPPIWQNSNTLTTKQSFSITIDHTDNIHAYVTVERNGAVVVPKFDVRVAPEQAAVPANWLVSFTGGTGGNHNIHEISLLSICATFMNNPGGSSIAGAFECMETGTNLPWVATARKPLYTKLVGTDFKFDIAALKTGGTLESNYVAAGGNSKYAKVELFDDTTPPASCSAYANPVGVPQVVTFASGTYSGAAGRTLTANFKLNSVYKKLRCRVKECTDSACTSFTSVEPACSSDRFSVRPAAFWVTKNTPAFNAGSTFTLQATAVKSDLTNITTNYTEAPTLNIGQITGTPDFTAAALAPSALPAATAGVSFATFTYDDVGSFTLPATSPGTYGVSDRTFTSVDGSSDCIAGSASNTPVPSGSDKGKIGCLIGQAAALTVGRFYPDHFDIEISPEFKAGCQSGDFTYMDQPFTLGYIITAKSLKRTTINPPGNVALRLYSGGEINLAAINESNDWVTRLSLATSNPPTPAVSNPLLPPWTNGSHILTPTSYKFTRPTTTPADDTWGAFDALNIGVAIDDPDGRGYSTETLIFSGATPAPCMNSGTSECRKYASLTGGAPTKMRFGRLKLSNAHGSELLDLPVPLVAQFWNGNAFVTNKEDSCTSVVVPELKIGASVIATNVNSPFASGNGGLRLTRPNIKGYVDITIPTDTWLQFPWRGGVGRINPTARATFGVYKNAREFIYIREMY